MAVRTTPPISFNADIVAEFNGVLPHQLTEYYRGGANVPNETVNNGVPTAGQISITDFYGAEGDNALSSYTHNSNVYITGASSSDSWGYSSDADTANTNPTSTETMYWNPGDQPFDGTTEGSLAAENMGRLFRRFSGSNDGGIYCQSNGRFGDIQGGSDNSIQSSTSGVWAFPWQKITKGAHTFSGNYYNQVSSYPSAGTTYQALYLVEYDNWTLDTNDNTRGILSNQVARTLLFSRTATSNETNWNAQTWSKAHTTTGRYLCLEWHGSTNPNHYTKYYMSCRSVS